MENSESLYQHYSFSVQPGQEPLRIDKYLMNFVENAQEQKFRLQPKMVVLELTERLLNQIIRFDLLMI